MDIAIVADPRIPVPPKLYGVIERIVDMLIRGLVERGHEVALFVHQDSDVPCSHVPYSGTDPQEGGTCCEMPVLGPGWRLSRPMWFIASAGWRTLRLGHSYSEDYEAHHS